MLKLPDKLNQQFDSFLFKKTLSDQDKFFYKEWLHFYWNFCHKYHHDVFHRNSLPLFLKKLQKKGQSELQQGQATDAVTLFYEMHSVSNQYLTTNKSLSGQFQHNDTTPEKIGALQANIPSDYFNPPSTKTISPPARSGSNWVFVFDQLVSEIKLCDYSPKTLKAQGHYCGIRTLCRGGTQQ